MKTKEEYARFYEKARRIIGDRTPLKTDCGILCGGSCCKGDEDTGMLLFPGEESELGIIEKDGVRLAVCDGSCNRDNRPLSCMIFPLFPHIDESGRITVIADARGKNICPLVENANSIAFDSAFIRRVARLGRYLKRDEHCRKFLYDVSKEIDLMRMFLN